MKIYVLTVTSTRTNKEGPNQDTAGPLLEKEILKDFPHCLVCRGIVTDDQIQIVEKLKHITCSKDFKLVITVGGTGFSKDDVTPEATRAVIDREAPGLVHALLSQSLNVTKMAMLSRPVCGIKDDTLVVNFPGSAKAAIECWGFIKDVLPHAADIISGSKERVQTTHSDMQSGGCFTESKVKIIAGADRLRKSSYPMIEVPEAEKIVFNNVSLQDWEEIPVSKSLSRILAEDITARDPIPPFPASIKDGYAVVAKDGAGKRRVRSTMAAGDDPSNTNLRSGEIVRISTGAALPNGANAVVQVEDTDLVEASANGEQEMVVEIKVAPSVGQDIRKIGSDCPKDALVLKKHSKISAAYIGILAMLGYTTVKVVRQPAVGVISTGNELVAAEATLKPGQIRDSNKLMLLNLLKSFGYEANDCDIAKDDPNNTKKVFEKAFRENDVVISSGGVSMGEFDLIKQVLIEDFGAEIQFGRLNMKPGKPTVFATLLYNGRKKYVFALPGNPVSCCVTSLLFVIPALKFMEQDGSFKGWPSVEIILQEDLVNKDIRPEYVRLDVCVNHNSELIGISTGNQISSRLNSMVDANALLLVPGRSSLEAGTKHIVYLFGQLHM